MFSKNKKSASPDNTQMENQTKGQRVDFKLRLFHSPDIPTVLKRFHRVYWFIQCSCLIIHLLTTHYVRKYPKTSLTSEGFHSFWWCFLLNGPECCAELLRRDFRGHECGAEKMYFQDIWAPAINRVREPFRVKQMGNSRECCSSPYLWLTQRCSRSHSHRQPKTLTFSFYI